MNTPVSWWPFILLALGAFWLNFLSYSLGHGRKFIKDAPSACRIRSHKSFWYETGNVLNKCWKETKAIVLMYFLPEVLFKKIKTALRIAFSWIVKKKKKKTAFRIAIFRPATGNRLVFFFGLTWKSTPSKGLGTTHKYLQGGLMQNERLLNFLTLVRGGLEKYHHKFSSGNWVYMIFYGVDT